MRTLTFEMPVLSQCEVAACGYNLQGNCHAKAITVGTDALPACDTYFDSSVHTSAVSLTAGVGACKVSRCRHNHDFECSADSIRVGMEQGQPSCTTFAPKH